MSGSLTGGAIAGAVFVLAAAASLQDCSRSDAPPGPRLIITPRYAFSPGNSIEYYRQNFDQNHNPTADFQHDVAVTSSGLSIGGFNDAAVVTVSTIGAAARVDSVVLAIEGGKLLLYDVRTQGTDRYPPVPLWNMLVDLVPADPAQTLLSFDSTFTIAMASGHTLRDRVTCNVQTRYAGEDILSLFGSPIVNCYVYVRTVAYGETVDTAGVLLFQGPGITLVDSLWFADGIGPVKMSSRGNRIGVDSLGLPFSLAALQVRHTATSHDSYEVHYARVAGRDSLALRESLYGLPGSFATVLTATVKNY